MKARDYYPTYIPRKWIHFAEHGKKYRIRKKYRNRIQKAVSRHSTGNGWSGDFETVLFLRLSKSLEELRQIIEQTFTPLLDWLMEVGRKIVKVVRDTVDKIWCNDRHWWYMAEHHKKRRIRKKYRNKIGRAARDRARKLLHSLTTDNSQGEQDDTEANDDEEVP